MAKPSLYELNNWDLEDLLKGKSLESLYQQWIKLNDEIVKQSKDFYKTLSNFKKWEKLGEEEEKVSNRLSNYISNKMSEDVSDQKYMAWEQKISNKAHEFGEKLSGLTQVVIENEIKIRGYLKNKDLQEKTLGYERVFRYKPHVLSKEVSKALSKISKNNGAVSSIFSTLTTEDIKFADAKDSKGKNHKIETMSVVSILLKNKDRELRKNTWLSFHKSFNNFQSTLTQTLFYNYTQLNSHAKLKNFKDYIDATCFSDEIEFKLIQKVYDNVLKYKPLYREYTDLTSYFLKKQLNLKKLEPWDNGVDLNKVEFKYSLSEAKEMILDCLSILGNEYKANLQRAFDEKWISFMPKKNKYTGAYSIGETYGLDKYYLLMNFNGTFDSVSTLSHELGHSMNSLYYGKKQKEYADTTIFTAEIPSILNETLLGMYMIDKYKNNKLAQRNFIRELLVNFFGTTTRQVVFSNFEYIANQWINEAKPFTKETVRKLYLDMTDKYIGIKNMKKTTSEPYSYALSTILRISHFYAGNFYVYKYAVGQIVAINVAKKILDGDKDIKSKLFTFLESGVSKSPLETIKILGIDMTTDKPYMEAGKFIKDLLKMYKKTK